jgi:hypothetical protein
MSEFERKRRRRWARLLAKVYGIDPEVCPACGERMRIVSAFTFPEQDSIIERILKHLKIWDPPWKKVRSPRGPPPPDPEEWPEAIDPPHPDLDFDATSRDEGME